MNNKRQRAECQPEGRDYAQHLVHLKLTSPPWAAKVSWKRLHPCVSTVDDQVMACSNIFYIVQNDSFRVVPCSKRLHFTKL